MSDLATYIERDGLETYGRNRKLDNNEVAKALRESDEDFKKQVEKPKKKRWEQFGKMLLYMQRC